MKIILANGTELSPLAVRGASSFIQGAKRDTLSFIFSADKGVGALDVTFKESACEKITIVGDNESESIYKGYTIRAGLKKAPVEVTPATEEAEAVIENRITVTMAQRTYAETQLSALTALLTGEE